jgi:TPR repeat protein
MTKKTDKARKADQLWQRASMLEDKGKIAEAVKLYRAAAKLGDASAQSNLGNLLDDTVSPKRSKEAVYWYKRAVKLGSGTAATNLAVHHKNLGQTRWQMHWLHVAAKLGDSDASKEIRKLKRQLERPSGPR